MNFIILKLNLLFLDKQNKLKFVSERKYQVRSIDEQSKQYFVLKYKSIKLIGSYFENQLTLECAYESIMFSQATCSYAL